MQSGGSFVEAIAFPFAKGSLIVKSKTLVKTTERANNVNKGNLCQDIIN